MALSEKEQRLLEQLEAALAAEDPKFASTLRGAGNRTLHRKRAALAGVAFAIGVGALVAGMEFGWVISVIGFVVMFAATVIALSAWRHVSEGDGAGDGGPGDGALFNRLDNRWRHRGDDDR